MQIAMRIRVKFEKRGPVRFASHKDVVRIIQRGVAAAGIPVSYSQGYHPHMRMSFGPPLKTGWEGYDEYLDIHFDAPVEGLAERCNSFMPSGLRFMVCSEVIDGTPKLANDISAARYEVRVRADELGVKRKWGAEELARTKVEIESRFREARDGGDPDPRVVAASVETDGDDLRIEYTSTMCSGRVVAPQDVAEALGAIAELPTPVRVARSEQFVARNGEYLSPLNEAIIQGTI
jgi:radical SAM-linked protein